MFSDYKGLRCPFGFGLSVSREMGTEPVETMRLSLEWETILDFSIECIHQIRQNVGDPSPNEQFGQATNEDQDPHVVKDLVPNTAAYCM